MPLLGRWPAPDPVPLAASLGVRVIEWISYVGNIGAFVLAVAAIRPVSKRVGIAYGVWIVVNIVPPVAEHLFDSTGRYVSVIFPVFFYLAARIPRSKFWQTAGAFAAAQALLAVWFFLWRGVF